MTFPTSLKQLCWPAFTYFIFSLFFLIVNIFLNINNAEGNKDFHEAMKHFKLSSDYIFVIYISNLIYVLFWTYILNLICKDKKSWLSWLLILLPTISLFMLAFLYGFTMKIVYG